MFKRLGLISALFAVLTTGAFANDDGIIVGFSIGEPFITHNNTNRPAMGYSTGINIGYQIVTSGDMGLRLYLDYYFNESFGNGTKFDHHLSSANVDFLFFDSNDCGIFIGIGAGLQSYNINDVNKMGFVLPVNVGLILRSDSFFMELGVKISAINSVKSVGGYNNLSTRIVSLNLKKVI